MKILHVITGLDTGGAEAMLYKLVSGLNSYQTSNVVVSLMGRDGAVGEKIESSLGVHVYYLGMSRGRPTFKSLVLLYRILKKERPDIVQGWMYHGNLLAFMSKILYSIKLPVVWNIRQSLPEINNEGRLTRFVIRINSLLSRFADAIVFNSRRSIDDHAAVGFARKNDVFIPNGFHLEELKSHPANKQNVRDEFGIDSKDIVVGMMARYDPIKDHVNFFNAAAILAKKKKNIKFLCVGSKVSPDNFEVVDQLSDLGVYDRFYLIGERKDAIRITQSFDVAVNSSMSEAFANVIGEAMACEVPCVVTDVGDSAYIVGNTGVVVNKADSRGLAEGIEKLVNAGIEERRRLGRLARKRIAQNFSLESVCHEYFNLYSYLINARK